MKKIVVLWFSLLVIEQCVGILTLSNVYGDNMVLQRAPYQAVISGTANPNVRITVGAAGRIGAGISGGDGSFYVGLPPIERGGPYTVQVNSSTGESVSLSNVLFGDVWLCGGQSNMQMTVNGAFNASIEIPKAENYPQIRVFTVGQGSTSDKQERQLLSIEQKWSMASATNSIGSGNDWSWFSAVCWFFGKDLADHNPGLPIGLISSNWGGTIVQAWMSPEALAKCPSNDDPVEHETEKVPPIVNDPDPNTPSVLWNAMIYPFLTNPIAGAIWYQGESNTGQAKQYACWFPAMITDWRAKWTGSNDFPFFFVQLSTWNSGSSTALPEIRDAQLEALKLPKVGFATAVDLGDIDSPLGEVHPRDKQNVGLRLSLSARALAYGERVVYLGPTVDIVRVVSNGPDVTADISFTPESVESGLVLRAFPECPVSIDQCGWYSILLSDSKWYNATSSSISPTNNKVVRVTLVNVGSGLTVRGLRYGYASWPMTNIYNGAGLPGIPFQHLF